MTLIQNEIPAAVGRILVRAVNWVGDTILTYPAVQRLKTRFPRSHLAILVQGHLSDLWKTCPFVDEVIPFEQKGKGIELSKDLDLASYLRKKKFDLAVIFPRSFRSACQVFLARIPVRIGYRDEWRSILLTHGVARTEEILRVHRIHYYHRLVGAFRISALGTDAQGTDAQGTDAQRTEERLDPPRLFLRDEDRSWARESLGKLGLLDGRPMIGINPGATYGLAKCWPMDRFGELGRRLAQKGKASIVLFGKADERVMTQEILKRIGEDGGDLTGKTGLLQLAAVLEHCQLLITNDTGTMHVATAVETPVVALFGPTDPVTTGPWGEGHTIVNREVDCSPCLKRVCPTDHRCMKKITVDEVEEIIDDRLKSIRR